LQIHLRRPPRGLRCEALALTIGKCGRKATRKSNRKVQPEGPTGRSNRKVQPEGPNRKSNRKQVPLPNAKPCRPLLALHSSNALPSRHRHSLTSKCSELCIAVILSCHHSPFSLSLSLSFHPSTVRHVPTHTRFPYPQRGCWFQRRRNHRAGRLPRDPAAVHSDFHSVRRIHCPCPGADADSCSCRVAAARTCSVFVFFPQTHHELFRRAAGAHSFGDDHRSPLRHDQHHDNRRCCCHWTEFHARAQDRCSCGCRCDQDVFSSGSRLRLCQGGTRVRSRPHHTHGQGSFRVQHRGGQEQSGEDGAIRRAAEAQSVSTPHGGEQHAEPSLHDVGFVRGPCRGCEGSVCCRSSTLCDSCHFLRRCCCSGAFRPRDHRGQGACRHFPRRHVHQSGCCHRRENGHRASPCVSSHRCFGVGERRAQGADQARPC
jgi:hypothetical protein